MISRNNRWQAVGGSPSKVAGARRYSVTWCFQTSTAPKRRLCTPPDGHDARGRHGVNGIGETRSLRVLVMVRADALGIATHFRNEVGDVPQQRNLAVDKFRWVYPPRPPSKRRVLRS